jgi:hypothetical protein
MNNKQSAKAIAIAVMGLTMAACATSSSQDTGYNAFLQKIAADCKPLVIGSDDFGQAIIFNGTGAQSDHYSAFLSRTQALYSGSLPEKDFRDAYADTATNATSKKAIDCVILHARK